MIDDSLSPAQRSLRVLLAAHTHQADTEAQQARAERIDRASRDRFADQVDPDHTLKPEERAKRARSARRAYYTALALRSSRVRAIRRSGGEK